MRRPEPLLPREALRRGVEGKQRCMRLFERNAMNLLLGGPFLKKGGVSLGLGASVKA